MRLFYFKEKPTTHLHRGSRNMKKHVFERESLFGWRFVLKWKLLTIYEDEKKWGEHINGIYKIMNAWLKSKMNAKMMKR